MISGGVGGKGVGEGAAVDDPGCTAAGRSRTEGSEQAKAAISRLLISSKARRLFMVASFSACGEKLVNPHGFATWGASSATRLLKHQQDGTGVAFAFLRCAGFRFDLGDYAGGLG